MSGPSGVGTDRSFSTADEPASINRFVSTMEYLGYGFTTTNYGNIYLDYNGFEVTAVYSRGGREIYRTSGPVTYAPLVKLSGPDFTETSISSQLIQIYVSDIFDDKDHNQHQVYDIRVPLSQLVRVNSLRLSPYKDYALYGGFEVTSDASHSKCAHTDPADYGTHVQPVPYVCAKTEWAGQIWKGLDPSTHYKEWFVSRNDGAAQWTKETNDWSSKIVSKSFAINFPHVGCTSPDGKLTETAPFKLNLSLIYPFIVKKPVAQSASTAAAGARAAAEPAYATTIGIHKMWKTLPVSSVKLPDTVITGIDVVESDADADNARRDVCTPAGVVVLRDVTLEEAEKTLSPGVYLFGTEKIVIK